MKTNVKLIKSNNNRLNQDNLRNKAIIKGVNFLLPETVYLSKDTKFGKNITIEPYVYIGSKVIIGDNVVIKSFSHLEGCKIEKNVSIGPYARLRNGTKISPGAKIGNFVETKNSTINAGSKINHLSYIGDTKIGKNVNVGAGVITCNYDGIKKNKTLISDNVFVGSNSSLVAPIKIQKNSVIGAGSVITKNVSKNSLALSRAGQKEISNYKRKKK